MAMKNTNILSELYKGLIGVKSWLSRGFVLILALFTLAVGNVWGKKGFFSDNQWKVGYWTGGSDTWSAYKNNATTLDLGVQTTLYLKGCNVQTWNNDGWTISKVVWYYGWSSKSTTYSGQVTGSSTNEDHEWYISQNRDLISIAPNNPGNNTLWMFWRMDDYSAVDAGNSKITFTIPGFTNLSTTSVTFDNTTVGSDNSKSITYTHYGTAPTNVAARYSITGTNADQFSITALSGTGATIKFTPTSAGTKTATLVINDVHGKTTGSITLTGTGTAPTVPTLILNSVTPDALISGNDVTITTTRSNTSNAISFEYTTNNGTTWNSLTPKSTSNSGQTAVWTIPEAHGATQTYKFRAKITADGLTTDASSAVSAYGKKTIYVRNTNDWATFKMHHWGDANATSMPGNADNISSYGGQWKSVVILSSYNGFILNDGAASSGHQSYDLSYSTIPTSQSVTDGSYWEFATASASSGGAYKHNLTLSSAPTAPTVTTAAASSIAATSATLGGSVTVNQDKVTERGYYWSTDATLSASKLGVGTKVTISGTNNTDGDFSQSKTGLTNGTTYYVIAYATNGFGTSYGSVVNFRTKFVTTVTLDKRSGTNGTNSVSATEGSAMPSGKTAPTRTGYTFGGYYKNTDGSGTQYYTNAMASANNWDVAASTATIYAKWTPITYTVTYNANGGTGTTANSSHTYDAAKALTTNGYSKAGYTFGGWATSQSNANAGTVAYTDGQSVTNLSSTQGATVELFAIWTPNDYTVTLSQTGAAVAGSQTSVTGTYNADMPAISGAGKLPTAPQGYAFMGYWDEANGNGTQYYDRNGTSAHVWDKTTDATLYAYFKKAVITALTFDAYIVEPGEEVGVTPVINPAENIGNVFVCWRVLYSNNNPLDPQPSFTRGEGNKITFNAYTTPGTYKVEATLHAGTDCSGTVLSQQVMNFQVAGDHTVTVQYKCGGTTIKASDAVNGKPLEWTSITAPDDIIGYTFHHWIAGDGITLSENGTDALTGARPDSSVSRTIHFQATYDGKLTAHYTKKNVIYFNNTLGWSDVWVYFYSSDKYWADDWGTGAYAGKYFNGNKPYSDQRHGHMTQIEGTNIWYFDYTAAGYGTYENIAFANMDKSNSGTDNTSDNDLGFFSNTTSDPIQVVRRGDHKASLPMFVPVVGQTGVKKNNNKAEYYNYGYWMNYPENTGYTLKIYNKKAKANNSDSEPEEIRSLPFEFTADKTMPMELTVDLEAGKTYGFKIYRNDGNYYGNANTMTANTENWAMTTGTGNCGLQTTAAGNYKFTFNYFEVSGSYQYRVGVTYPVATGDYQLLYKDNTMSKWFKSAIIPRANAADTVSFFVRKNESPILKLQKCTATGTGSVTWTDTVANLISSLPTAITKDSVYNFILTKATDGTLQLTKTEAYTGNYYIRTDCAGATKWDNFRTADHMMTYSEYSEHNSDFTHYWMKFVSEGTNIKFVVANDYSPNISDTLARQSYRGGDATHVNEDGFLNDNLPGDGVNIRFMWHRHTNAVIRAYLAPAQNSGSEFLVLRGQAEELLSKEGEALNSGNNNGAPDNSIQFNDNENWIYETNVQVKTGAYVKLYGFFHGTNFYFKGKNNSTFDGTKDGEGIPNAIQLITGNSDDLVSVRVIYDFKTDRLIAAMIPEGVIDDQRAINADVMFIREHQGEIKQLTFSGSGNLSAIKTAYGVMRFNKWTLNNKSTATGHAPLASPASPYERSLFFVSFPFRVKLNEVFGFGTYGVHWIIQYYDGKARAENGMWAETGTYWKFVWDRKDFILEPNVGYLLTLDLDLLGEDNLDVWGVVENERAELFFPSYGTMPNITGADVTVELPDHTCSINRTVDANDNPTGLPGGNDVRTTYDRRIVDSHWNVMGVPTYANTSAVAFDNDSWISELETSGEPKFLYTWNAADNTLTATSSSGYTFKAMHAYMVQYHGDVTWSAHSGSAYPAPIVARRTYREKPRNLDFCLEIQQNAKMIDRTYIDLNEDEETSAGFKFGEDMTKDFSGEDKTRIYSIIEGDVVAAGNDGEYTFAMPEGTNGVGITLIDTEANVRTSLSALDYTVTLSAGEYTNRFFLEISPVQNTPTDIENGGLMNGENGVRKVMIDGILYIVRDGKMYDARGARVE